MGKVVEYDKDFKEPEWPNVIQIIEVTPQKKVVWALREWTDREPRPVAVMSDKLF